MMMLTIGVITALSIVSNLLTSAPCWVWANVIQVTWLVSWSSVIFAWSWSQELLVPLLSNHMMSVVMISTSL